MNYHEYMTAKARIITLNDEIDEAFGSAETDEAYDKAQAMERELEELQRYVDAGAMLWEKSAVKPIKKPEPESPMATAAHKHEPADSKEGPIVKAAKAGATIVADEVEPHLRIGATVTWPEKKIGPQTGILQKKTKAYSFIESNGTICQVVHRLVSLVQTA